MFPGFLTPLLTQLFFPKPRTTFLTCFFRGERQKYTRKKSCLIRGSNSNHQVMGPTRSPGGTLNFRLAVAKFCLYCCQGFWHSRSSTFSQISVSTRIFIPIQKPLFSWRGGVLYWKQPVCPSICVSVCVQNTSFCQSACGGSKSHLVMALVTSTLGSAFTIT